MSTKIVHNSRISDTFAFCGLTLDTGFRRYDTKCRYDTIELSNLCLCHFVSVFVTPLQNGVQSWVT